MTTTLTTTISATGADYAIARCEALALDCVEEARRLRQRAVEYDAAGLRRTAIVVRGLANREDGKAEAFDIATAIIAGSRS